MKAIVYEKLGTPSSTANRWARPLCPSSLYIKIIKEFSL